MTGSETPSRGGPPWSLDLLADLHADVLDPQDADELRRAVAADPDARATLAALDATRAALAELPSPRMPADLAARLDAAITAEAAARAAAHTVDAPPRPAPAPVMAPPPVAAPAPVVDLTAERARRRRRGLIAGAGILTAAAAVVGVVAVANLAGNTTAGDPQAGPGGSDQATAPLAVSSSNLGEAVDDALGATDYGPLAGPGKLDSCLAANGIADANPVGAREVTLDGRPGVLVLLPAGSNPPRWRLLVVGPDCGPGRPSRLADTTTGR